MATSGVSLPQGLPFLPAFISPSVSHGCEVRKVAGAKIWALWFFSDCRDVTSAVTKCVNGVDKMQTVAYVTAEGAAVNYIDSLKAALH